MKQNISVVPQLFINNPLKALELGLSFIEQEKARNWDYNKEDGSSSEMPLITFRLTSLCNLRCVMCGQRGVTGTLKGQHALDEAKNLVSLERYMQLTDEVAGKAKVFYMWGGEPFMYPKFMDLAQYMASKIPIFTVNTNGLALAQNAERIVKDKWTGFFISLDGFRETNDAIRGDGSYQKVIDGIKAVNEQKKKHNSPIPHLGIVTTISNMNYMYLDQLVEATKDIGLSWHIINLGTYTTEKIGEEQRAYLKEKLGIDPYYWRGFANGYNQGIDGAKFQEILTKVHNIKCDHPVITVPVIKPELINTYYSDLEAIVRDKCIAPWFSVNINYNGDVHFCADYPDYIIGNIKNDKLADIYNSEKARAFRKALHDSPAGIFPACRRCYQLMLCGNDPGEPY